MRCVYFCPYHRCLLDMCKAFTCVLTTGASSIQLIPVYFSRGLSNGTLAVHHLAGPFPPVKYFTKLSCTKRLNTTDLLERERSNEDDYSKLKKIPAHPHPTPVLGDFDAKTREKHHKRGKYFTLVCSTSSRWIFCCVPLHL